MGNKTMAVATALAVATLLTSCDPRDVRAKDFRDSAKWGKVIRMDLDIQEFSEIELWSAADIEFFQDDSFHVQLEGNEKAVGAYKFETVADTLADSTVTACLLATWDKDQYSANIPTVRLRVYAPSLRSILVGGEGDVDLKDSVCVGDLSVRVSGSGDVDIRTLRCGDLKVEVSGSGDVSVKRLNAKSIHSVIDGSGEVRVRRGTLDGDAKIEVCGSGDFDGELRCRSIDASSTGAGDIDLEVECDELTVVSEGAGDIEVEGETTVLRKSRQALGTTTTKKLRAGSVEYIK